MAQFPKHEIAVQYLDSTEVLFQQGKFKSSIVIGQKALQFFKAQRGMDTLTAKTYEAIGKSMISNGQYDQALLLFDSVTLIRKQFYQSPHPELANILYRTSVAYYYKADYESALEYALQVVKMRSTLLESTHPQLLKSQFLVGSIAYQKGDFDTALPYFEQVLATRLKTLEPNHPHLLSSYSSIGAIHIERDEYEETLVYFEKGLNIAKKIYPPNHPDIGMAYGNLGMVYTSMGDYNKALEYYTKDFEISIKTHDADHPNHAFNHHRFGNIYIELRDFEKALFHYRKSKQLWMATYGPNSINTAWSYLGLGTTYMHLAEHKKALDYLNRAVNIFLKEFDKPNTQLTSAYHNLALVYQNLQQHEKSIEYFLRNIALLEKLFGEDHSRIANALNNLGQSYRQIGEYDRAIKAFKKSLYIRNKIMSPDNVLMSTTYSNLGLTYLTTDELTKANSFLQKSLAINNQEYDHEYGDNSNIFRTLGDIQNMMQKTDSALHYYHLALNIDTLVWGPAHPKTANDFLNIGNTLDLLGRNEEALQSIKKAIAIIEQTNGKTHPFLANYYYNLGQHYEKKDETKAAKKWLLSAFDLKRKSTNKSHPSMAKYYLALGENYFNNQIFDKASSYFDSTLICLNNIQKWYPNTASRKTHLSNARKYYEQVIKYDAAISKRKERLALLAFEASEKVKGNILLDALMSSKAKQFATISEELLFLEDSLKWELTYYDKQRNELLNNGFDETDTTVLAIVLAQLKIEEEYNKVIQKIEKKHPEYYRAKYTPQTIAIAELQKTIMTNDESIISYFVGNSTLFIFLIQKNNYEVFAVEKNFPLKEWVNSLTKEGIYKYYTQSLSKRTPKLEQVSIENYTNAAQQLYQKLLRPIEDRLTKKLIIIPDGILGYIPFETLLKSKPRHVGAFASYPFLVYDHQISYNYSATLMNQMQQKQHRQNPSASLLAMAPFYQGHVDTLISQIDTLSLFALRDSLMALPASGEEIASIQKLMKGTSWYGQEASIKQFRMQSPLFRIVHLSTHGKADDRVGDYAFLAFKSDESNKHFEKLYARDLYNYNFNADLVVLSACETGIGKLQKGEGIISLARAFAFAGAKSVFTTLWQVNDVKTKDLIIEFYKKLRAGEAKDIALHQAKLDYLKINDGMAKHPFFWAGLIGIGDMSKVQH